MRPVLLQGLLGCFKMQKCAIVGLQRNAENVF